MTQNRELSDIPTYRIKDWSRQFENHDSRRVNYPRWVPMPNKHDGKSYRRLISRPNGLCIFGAWVLMVEIASKMPIRGVLADHDGPLTAEDLAAKTGAPVEMFEEALSVLSEPKIGWLTTEICTDSQAVNIVSAALGEQSKGEKDITEKGKTERQPKPRRAELYPIPPDSMLELCDSDLAWLAQKAPHVPDFARATEKWFLKQQTNRTKSKTLEEWKASWRGYMMNYSDSELSRNNGNGKTNYSRSTSIGSSSPEGIDNSIWDRAKTS